VRNRLGRHPQRLVVGGVGHPARFLLVAEHQIHVVE
jgi:hypothetical protein